MQCNSMWHTSASNTALRAVPRIEIWTVRCSQLKSMICSAENFRSHSESATSRACVALAPLKRLWSGTPVLKRLLFLQILLRVALLVVWDQLHLQVLIWQKKKQEEIRTRIRQELSNYFGRVVITQAGSREPTRRTWRSGKRKPT